MEKSELDLFDKLIAYIKATYPKTLFHVIDLGSGNGLKAKIFIEKLGEKNVKAYYPVDIQPIELAAALNAHQKGQYGKHPTLLDFENLPSRFPLKVLPNEKQIFLFLGGTYGNFPHLLINNYLKPLISSSAILIIAMPLRASKKTDEEIIHSYTSSNIESVAFGPLIQVGFEKKDFERNPYNPEFHVVPVIEDGRLLTVAKLKQNVTVLGRVFTKGTVFKFTTSWKPQIEEVKAAIGADYTIDRIIHNNDMSLSLVTKLR